MWGISCLHSQLQASLHQPLCFPGVPLAPLLPPSCLPCTLTAWYARYSASLCIIDASCLASISLQMVVRASMFHNFNWFWRFLVSDLQQSLQYIPWTFMDIGKPWVLCFPFAIVPCLMLGPVSVPCTRYVILVLSTSLGFTPASDLWRGHLLWVCLPLTSNAKQQ